MLNKVYVPFYDQQIQLYYIRLKSNLFFYIPPCGFLPFQKPFHLSSPWPTSTVRGSPGRYRDLKNNDQKFTWVEWPERDLSASEIGIRMSSKWALNEISTSFLRLYELSPSYVKSLYDFS